MFDPFAVLRRLNDHEVRYVVIGGYAAGILGAPIVTSDLDICHQREPANLERLAAALQAMGARLRVAGVDEGLPFVLGARTLAADDSFTFTTEFGDVDVLATPSGTGGFRDLDAKAAAYDLGDGLVVRVCDLDDLIRMKEASARLKDEAHLHVLAVLRDMLRQG